MNGGRFDFDDGGTYCGGWEEGKAHGHGVCTGPRAQGEFAGAWHYGFELSGVYTWPSGNAYEGQWQNGKRHGLGVEHRGRWLYRGEWTQGYKGRYGLRQAVNSQARYQGTWSSGLHDGYGIEVYADGGFYQGQWLRGMRHGYGFRKSATYGVASKFRSRSHAHASLTSLRSDQDDEGDARTSFGDGGYRPQNGVAMESRGGFVLRACSEPPQRRRRSLSERSLAVKRTILSTLHLTKQRSTGDLRTGAIMSGSGSIRSSGSSISLASEDSGGMGGRRSGRDAMILPHEDHIHHEVTESYMGEWKNDKRSGFGLAERSDGLRYEGEWFNNCKYGYGVTRFKDGTMEEGKYKNNVLVSTHHKKGLLFVRSSKFRERIETSVGAAVRTAQIAQQKADIAVSRAATARDRAEHSDAMATQAQEDSNMAKIHAKQFDPSFNQPGVDSLRHRRLKQYTGSNHVPYGQSETSSSSPPLPTAQPSFDDSLIPVIDRRHESSSTSANYADKTTMSNVHVQQSERLDERRENYGNGEEEWQQMRTGASTETSQFHPSPHNLPLTSPESVSFPLKQIDSSFGNESLLSVCDDHFDQYTTTGNLRHILRIRPSLRRQPDVLYDSLDDRSSAIRRATLATIRDGLTIRDDVSNLPRTIHHHEHNDNDNDNDNEPSGSLPNLTKLDQLPVHMRREEAANLASRQRQEVQQYLVERAMLRRNPLRYLLHPAFRAWLTLWRLPLALLTVNICLFLIFYHLLTCDKPGHRTRRNES